MRYAALPALALLAASCESTSTSPAPPAPASPPAATPPAADARLPNEVPTRTLAPTPVRIDVSDLPAPGATSSARKPPRVVPVPDDATLNVPEGFAVQVYAEGLQRPRTLRRTPEGDVLVAESRDHRLTLLHDANGDGVAEQRRVVATAANDLNNPFGLAFVGGALYVGNEDRLTRHAWRGGQPLDGPGTRLSRFASGHTTVAGGHWTRDVIPTPDGQGLYVAIGSRSNVDREDDNGRALVLRMGLDGSNVQTVATGLRNPVALATHPRTGALYTVVNERDGLGDDLVPDYFTRVEPGAFYGWPYAYLTPRNLDPRRTTASGQSERPDLAARTRTPEVLLESHAAALGLVHYDHAAFPARYRGGYFVAMHGSWNRSQAHGYKVVFVPAGPDGQPTGGYEDFLTGFVLDPDGPTAWGRPVSLMVLADGSLLLSEDGNGRVYRISYRGAAR